ncbi:hypothetical protein GQ54DRAFT_212830 [Martensiomyces pterosporus]|nr:hypothetical protein GQ54DRAFT_212830 [Martensiomyces pterosporus]
MQVNEAGSRSPEHQTTAATTIDGTEGSEQGHLPQPKFAVDRSSVCDIERQACREFFQGKANKTPERYMTIRNYMVDQWQSTRPQYLTKIRARAGLRHCGDVNAIGRVHTFLERANIINVGVSPTRRKPAGSANGRARAAAAAGGRRTRTAHESLLEEEEKEEESEEDDQSESDAGEAAGAHSYGAHSSSGRRRRVRDEEGNWVYEDEYYGGHVISHDVVVRRADDADDADYSYSSGNSDHEDGYSTGRRSKRQRRGHRQGDGANGTANGVWWAQNSEFRLIPCRTFAGAANGSQHKEQEPFTVSVSAAALALMDLHAHLMYTEIIGLLGGQYNARKRQLVVEVAFPCRSTSTTTECEMDPASEVEARRVFSTGGRQVVGWFHSHPTFDAMPSVRDIHNQHAYQVLCRRSDDQVEPFVGLIVSPPGGNSGRPFGVSDISVFYVVPKKQASSSASGEGAAYDEDEEDIRGADGIPYHIPYTVCDRDAIPAELIDMMVSLVEEHAHKEHRADLAKRFKRNEVMTTLEKLVLSMRSHWGDDVRQQWDESVSERLRPLLHRYFCKSSKHHHHHHHHHSHNGDAKAPDDASHGVPG